jgi:hypothetical protein
MMKVWVLQGSYEGELFSSVHLTQKGCALAAIADVFDFLGVECKESALRVINNCYAYTETDGEQTEPFEWDFDKLKEMKSNQIWAVFSQWTETCWEHMSERAYQVDGMPMEIQA